MFRTGKKSVAYDGEKVQGFLRYFQYAVTMFSVYYASGVATVLTILFVKDANEYVEKTT